MKKTTRVLGVAVIAIGLSLLSPTTLFARGGGGGGGGGHGGGGFGGGHGGFGGGGRGGFGRGFGGRGFYGGYGRYGYGGGWGWGGWGWGWPYYGYDWPYYYGYGGYPYYDYYYPYNYNYGNYYPYNYYTYPSSTYDPPQATYSSPPQVSIPDVNPPSSAIVADRNGTPYGYDSQTLRTLSLADVKALVKEGLSDGVILSQIRNSQAVYHLTTAEIIDLKQAGVSEKVIDYMINTASGHR